MEPPNLRALSVLLLCSLAAPAANTLYTIETFAGTTFTGDGKSASAAVLVQPSGIAIDAAGNVYIADAGDHRVRRVGTNGIIQTVAGTGLPGLRGEGGPATQAQLNTPYGLALDTAGNLFIADLGNACIRKLGADGRLTTVAGGGVDRPLPLTIARATEARLTQPRDVAVDRFGNLLIADFGAHMVYQVTPDGTLVVIAGTGEEGQPVAGVPAVQTTLSYPAAVTVDGAGTLYIADSGNHRVRRMVQGVLFPVCDKAGREIELGAPTGLAIDTLGRLYIADGATRTTVVSPSGDFLSVAGGGTAVAVSRTMDVYTAVERQIMHLNGTVPELFAGTRTGPGAGDGTDRTLWRLTLPSAIAQDNFGVLYIADTGNGRVRRLTPAGQLSTVTAKFAAPVSLAFDSQWRLHVGDRATGAVYAVDVMGQTRLVAQSESRGMNPAAIAFDPGDNLLIADASNHLLRKVTPAGVMTTIAGGGNQSTDGPALLARLASPAGLAVDAQGDVWFTEAGAGRLRRLSNSRITTLTGPDLREPRALRIESGGSFLIADHGYHRIFRVQASGEWMPLAGTGDLGFSGDGGFALAGMLNGPSDILASGDGALLVADTGNHRIRRLAPTESQPDPPVTQEPAPLTAPVEVVHAATLRSQPVAPGQIIFLQKLIFPPNAQVRIGEFEAPVLTRAQDRLAVQVPAAIREGAAELSIRVDGKTITAAALTVTARAPGLLTVAEGAGQAVAANETGEANAFAAPADRGSILTLYLTGEGLRPENITAQIGGNAAEVLWAGPAPGWPGLFQVNVRTPGGFSPSGVVPVSVSVSGIATQPDVTVVSR